MLVFDQLKKEDPQLRVLAVLVLAGMVILFSGLWWVQIVSASHFREQLETQSTRTVRLPAVRGNILDRDGRVLAANRPSYNVELFLEDLSKKFQATYSAALSKLKKDLAAQKAEAKKKLTHPQSRAEEKLFNKQFVVSESMKSELQQKTRYEVSSNIVAELSARLEQRIPFDQKTFQRRYDRDRILPLPVLLNLNGAQIARFEEQSMHTPGMDLDIQSVRSYPNNSLAAHLLGYVNHNNDSGDLVAKQFNYRLDDYEGKSGIERFMDKDLGGQAGEKSVVVNSLGYSQRETIDAPVVPGRNVVLTIDLDVQKAAEAALAEAQANVRGAVVVMDAQNGDVLVMASAPTYDPNFYAEKHDPATSAKEIDYLSDTNMRPQINRAMQENYEPGSIFKIVVGLAGLEAGTLNPTEKYMSPGNFPMRGLKKPIGDTAGPGEFDFDRALAKSSNPYFIFNGLKPGVLPRVIALGHKLHLGERTEVINGQEARGHLPSQKDITSSSWYPVETAYLSIGQGQVSVTPLQMAVMTTAVANGGKVFWPRLVARTESYGGTEAAETFAAGQVRDTLGVSARNLQIVREAMRKEVESPEGTGHGVVIPDFDIAGKTGTAEVEKNGHKDRQAQDTWFVSFAPYQKPRYVVVAMVEGGASGGKTCVPVVRKIYEAILRREQQREKKTAPRRGTLAEMQ